MVIANDAISKVGYLCSCMGKEVLSGNVVALKYLYGNAWRESPVQVKTISLLQDCLTAVEIERDKQGFYCDEFLYYWAMLSIGEQSKLIVKDLGSAEICLERVKKVLPKAEARLAYIKLLRSTGFAKSEWNVKRIDILRKWAGKKDVFSQIVLARIIFYQFLAEADETETNELEPPIRVCRLLEPACQKGHPVAIRFWNEIMTFIGNPTAKDMLINETRAKADVLFDFETSANMQLRP